MDLTQLLASANAGNEDARMELIRVAYDNLKSIAAGRMRDQALDHTLGTTALVNEAAVKILTESRIPVKNHVQFYAYMSTAMRNLLIDHARAKGRQKRGGGVRKLEFRDAMDECENHAEDVLALHESLKDLAKIKPRHAQVVEMRYFGGLSNQEIAEALGTSPATVKRDWVQAKSWLLCDLAGDLADD